MIRIRLDEASFRDLVRGKVVEIRPDFGVEPVQIILSDIGFDQMLVALHEAILDAPAYKRWRND